VAVIHHEAEHYTDELDRISGKRRPINSTPASSSCPWRQVGGQGGGTYPRPKDLQYITGVLISFSRWRHKSLKVGAVKISIGHNAKFSTLGPHQPARGGRWGHVPKAQGLKRCWQSDGQTDFPRIIVRCLRVSKGYEQQVCARCFLTIHRQLNIDGILEIHSVERVICPIATLYSLAASYKGGRCKQGVVIFHGGWAVVNFVPQFVAMATGVGRREILMTPSDSPDPKIGG